jgi:DNA polymerase I
LSRRASPIPIRDDVLFVAYLASAELGCYLSLGWDTPRHILDLYVEFRCMRSGLGSKVGFGLLGCATYHGIDTISLAEKESMRQLILTRDEWSESERFAILEYCQHDVDTLISLMPVMFPKLHLAHAICRGRYMNAVARMERNGVPIDRESLDVLRSSWHDIQDRLIQRVDTEGIYEGTTFKVDRFKQFLATHGIGYPRLESGALDLSSDTLRSMANAHPVLRPYHELRCSLSQLRLESLAVGQDNRNRVMLCPFSSTTGRNQPSNNRSIFGPARWIRLLIKPEEGRALSYIDWAQQEFGIAAALSGDANMMAAYRTGDPYLAFAKQAGRVTPNATKQTHRAERELFKACILGVQYGMGGNSLATRINLSPSHGNELIELHKRVYATYWRWSERVEFHAMIHGWLSTVYGWLVHTGNESNSRSARNFPMQGNGAEMLRLACSMLTERGIKVCAPIHDAILIEDDCDKIDDTVQAVQEVMRLASRIVLDGFELDSEAKTVRYPERYVDERGASFWEEIWRLL